MTEPLDPNEELENLSYDLVRAEMSLENIGFFTPAKTQLKYQVKTKTFKQRHEGEEYTSTVAVTPSLDLGLPITSDLDYYRAFQKVLEIHVSGCSDLSIAIAVPTKRIISMAGKSYGTQERVRVQEWFDRMVGTRINGKIYWPKKGKYLKLIGSVFSQVRVVGDEMPDGTFADTNYVWLAPWYQDNLLEGYLRTVDLDFHNNLDKPIAKSLYPILDTGWHATGHKPFRKSYSSLRDEFLLREYKQLSQVKKQLEPALKELRATGYLKAWNYKVAKATPHDWIISFVPGERFFMYQEQRGLKLNQYLSIKSAQEMATGGAIRSHILTPHQEDLLEQILNFCGERNNPIAVVGFKRVVQNYPPDTVQAALTETRLADRSGTIKRSKGAYFHDIVKHLEADRQKLRA